MLDADGEGSKIVKLLRQKHILQWISKENNLFMRRKIHGGPFFGGVHSGILLPEKVGKEQVLEVEASSFKEAESMERPRVAGHSSRHLNNTGQAWGTVPE